MRGFLNSRISLKKGASSIILLQKLVYYKVILFRVRDIGRKGSKFIQNLTLQVKSKSILHYNFIRASQGSFQVRKIEKEEAECLLTAVFINVLFRYTISKRE